MAAFVEQPDVALEGLPYQNLLRSIGAYLDTQIASQMCVLETADGFLVRYQDPHFPSRVTSVQFDVEDLARLSQKRQGSGTPQAARPPASGPYQDILRALGYELEHASARQIILEELDGTYVLAYYSPDTEDGPRVRKYRMIITPAETEEILRRARGRRRSPTPGWLLQSSSVASDSVRLVRVTDAAPVFRPTPGVIFEYTIPALTARSTEAILQSQNAGVRRVYRANRVPEIPQSSPEVRLLRPFEAAKLITAVHARCLDPIRFPGASQETIGKGQVLATLARCLTIQKMLAAVELVARHVEDLRSLDTFQPRLGTNTVRWMQYLATEVLSADPSELSQERRRLLAALSTIRTSETVADRFAAIRQHSPTEG